MLELCGLSGKKGNKNVFKSACYKQTPRGVGEHKDTSEQTRAIAAEASPRRSNGGVSGRVSTVLIPRLKRIILLYDSLGWYRLLVTR